MTNSSTNIETISVVIPLYYRYSRPDLENCLRSISLQTRPPNNILIGINGKTSYPQRWISRVVNEIHAAYFGPAPLTVYFLSSTCISDALNNLINASSCDWICRMDADDAMCNSRIDVFYRYLMKQSCAHEKHVFYSSAFVAYHNKINSKWNAPASWKLPYLLSVRNPIIHPSAFIRRSTLIRVGYYRDLHSVEDYDLWLRIYRDTKHSTQSPFCCIPEPLIFYNARVSEHKLSMNTHAIFSRLQYQIKAFRLLPNPLLFVLSILPGLTFFFLHQFLRYSVTAVFCRLRSSN